MQIHIFSILLDIYPGVELLGQVVTLCLPFQGTIRLFSTPTAPLRLNPAPFVLFPQLSVTPSLQHSVHLAMLYSSLPADLFPEPGPRSLKTKVTVCCHIHFDILSLVIHKMEASFWD